MARKSKADAVLPASEGRDYVITVVQDRGQWPDDFENWPSERFELFHLAMVGFGEGTLIPLANYMRAGWPVEGVMAEVLASMIDGCGWNGPDPRFEIVVKGRNGNKQTLSKRRAEHQKRMRIALFVERRIKQGWTVDNASGAAAEKWGCSRRSIDNARAYLKRAQNGETGFDTWFEVYPNE